MVGRIFDRLVTRYGKTSVFMDIDNIPYGIDFRKHIQETLQECDMVLAVVGPRWLGADTQGSFRINNAADPVRVEIETALRRGIPLIPVLVEGATMPDASQLPESLSEFAFRNAAPVDVGRDFHIHMDRLTRSIDHILQTKDSPPLSAPHDTSDQGRIDLQSGQEPTPGATAPFRVSSQPTESAERKAASTPSAKPFPPQAPAASADTPTPQSAGNAAVSPRDSVAFNGPSIGGHALINPGSTLYAGARTSRPHDQTTIIFAASLGTALTWYDFYLYGSLASIIGAQFFSAYPPATRNIFSLLAFIAGFLVRPLGAIVFGRIGDIIGRKFTFLVTITIMGLSTFIVGLLPRRRSALPPRLS
jgi:hypothetical protein